MHAILNSGSAIVFAFLITQLVKNNTLPVTQYRGHSTLRTLHPENKILEMKLFFTNLSFVVFI